MLRKTTFHTALLTSACLFTSAAFAASFNIPGGDLKSALDAYARQSGITLMYSPDAVKGAQSGGATGNLTNNDALSKILSGTGLSQYRTESGEVGIIRRRSSEANEIQPLQLAQAAPAGRIEEVLVTARKREEAVENIPISITALNAEDLKSFGVRNFADLEGVVPGLNMGGGGNGVKKDGNPFIRGVGQRETKVTLDPAVATYIEGIYIGRAGGALMDVVDVESIQVLRGPQGTLFGKNATGGAISVSLKKPNNNWEASLTANIGNYGRRDISGTINIPFVEDFVMGRLTVASTNSNGFFTNINDNTKWGGDNRVTGIAQLRILPTDSLTVDIFGERTRIRETPRPQRCAWVRATNFTTFQMGLINGTPKLDGLNRFEALCKRSQALSPSQFVSDEQIGNFIPQGRYWVDTSTAAVTVNWDVGTLGPISGFNVKSISAWRKSGQIADEDLDAVGAPFLIRVQPDFDETIQWSQELQFSGRTFHDRLFVTTGGYFFKERTPRSDLIISAGVSPPVASTSCTGCYASYFAEPAKERLQTDNTAYAWFGQADFDLTKALQLSAGVRWTMEKRWSRYSKAYADFSTVYNGLFSQLALYSGAMTYAVFSDPVINPISDWQFRSAVYSVGLSSNGANQTTVINYVTGLFSGDELSTTDVGWTPMVSLKYKAPENVLQRLRLDQAMVYATYSQGFHSGGVTAGGIEKDSYTISYTNRPADPPNTPCPLPTSTSCTLISSLPTPGYGTADPITFRPEKVSNYEVGLKFAGLDRRLQASLSAFYMNYTDMQVTAVGNRAGIPVPYIENVGRSVIKGFELETVAMPTQRWRITMNGSYTDADIKEWMSQIIALGFDGTPSTTSPTYYIDRSDERMPRVPRWQFFASTDYNFTLPWGGSITPSVGVRFNSSIYHGFDRGSWVYTYGGYYNNHNGDRPPSTLPTANSCTRPVPATTCGWNGGGSVPQPDPLVKPLPDAKWKTTSRPTAFMDARLSWISEDGKMEGALWGKNLTNKDDYLVGGIPLADVTGAVGQVFANPRTFGLTFTYHFGE